MTRCFPRADGHVLRLGRTDIHSWEMTCRPPTRSAQWLAGTSRSPFSFPHRLPSLPLALHRRSRSRSMATSPAPLLRPTQYLSPHGRGFPRPAAPARCRLPIAPAARHVCRHIPSGRHCHPAAGTLTTATSAAATAFPNSYALSKWCWGPSAHIACTVGRRARSPDCHFAACCCAGPHHPRRSDPPGRRSAAHARCPSSAIRQQ